MKPRVVLHPIVFGTYPVLFAYAHNIDFAPPATEVLLLLAAIGGATVALWLALAAWNHNPRKAALEASIFTVLFFAYGHLATLVGVPLAHFHIGAVSFGANRAPAAAWIGLVIACGWLIHRLSENAVGTATRALNRIAIVLLAFIGVDLATSVYASGHSTAVVHAASAAAPTSLAASRPGSRDLPDIYYIILDDYARADVLKSLYDFDNTPFLDTLRSRGFFVADESTSNYSQTMLSLASSLNSQFLEGQQLESIADRADPSWHVALNVTAARYFAKGRAFGYDDTGLTTSRLPLAHMIQYSSAVRTLKDHGYRFVAFTSGYGGVQLPNADVAMHAQVLDDFEELLVDETPVPRAFERFYDPIELHRARVRYVFDHLPDVVGAQSPQFVFAHVLCPHTPFAFDADGRALPPTEVIADDRLSPTNPKSRAELVRGYRDQIAFVNHRIDQIVGEILARSPKPPIIILQSDHGSEMTLGQEQPSDAGIRERMAILNAYYVPQELRARLYPQISPVNTFRLILAHYFGGGASPLPDDSYFSTWASPYAFVRVTDLVHTPGAGRGAAAH